MLFHRIIGAMAWLVAASLPAFPQSIAGIKIGDPAAVLNKISGEPTAHSDDGRQNMQGFSLSDGNYLSVTMVSDRVVYIELDRRDHSKSTDTKFMNLQFGQTSLSELRRTMGSNGFAFKHGPGFQITKDGAILANAYELDGAGEVITLVTLIPTSDFAASQQDVGDYARLEAIILADSKYLDSLWGREKIFDPSYKKVSFPAN